MDRVRDIHLREGSDGISILPDIVVIYCGIIT